MSETLGVATVSTPPKQTLRKNVVKDIEYSQLFLLARHLHTADQARGELAVQGIGRSSRSHEEGSQHV
jgi:hypothetical protein